MMINSMKVSMMQNEVMNKIKKLICLEQKIIEKVLNVNFEFFLDSINF